MSCGVDGRTIKSDDRSEQKGKRLFDDDKPHSPYEIMRAYAERKYTQYTEESNK